MTFANIRPFLAAAAFAVVATLAPASSSAAVHEQGRHGACYDSVAVREKPDGPAKDNLAKNQTFVVTADVGGNYVYGYKLVNGVHGWVLSASIDKSCLSEAQQ